MKRNVVPRRAKSVAKTRAEQELVLRRALDTGKMLYDLVTAEEVITERMARQNVIQSLAVNELIKFMLEIASGDVAARMDHSTEEGRVADCLDM